MRIANSTQQTRRGSSIALLAITVINVILLITLTRIVYSGSITGGLTQIVPALKVTVANQPDSPLLITIVSIDDSNPSRAVARYLLRNVSNKAIKGFTIVEREKREQGENLNPNTIDYAFSSLPPQGYVEGLQLQRFQPGGEVNLSIDFVQFTDGVSWGEDAEKGSETIAGRDAGRARAIAVVRELSDHRRTNEMIDLLKKDTTTVETPTVDSKQTPKWQGGFTQGYRSVLSLLRSTLEKQGVNSVLPKLEEFERVLRKEGR